MIVYVDFCGGHKGYSINLVVVICDLVLCIRVREFELTKTENESGIKANSHWNTLHAANQICKRTHKQKVPIQLLHKYTSTVKKTQSVIIILLKREPLT